MTVAYGRFIAYSNIVLGAIIGLLIAIPISPLLPSMPLVAVSAISSTLLGAMVGRRRGESRGFLYFALVAVLVLASTISRSFITPQESVTNDQSQRGSL